MVTTMQEPTLHGWRLADRKHMRMSGYSARVRSLGLERRRRLARDVGGAAAHPVAVPGKDGPMGKQPRVLRRLRTVSRSSRAIPKAGVAAGFADGMVLIVRIEDGAAILAKNPGVASASALAWSADGMLLAFGTENGEAGVIDPRLMFRSRIAAAQITYCRSGG